MESMDAVHFHLLANHVVILAVIFGIPLLLVGLVRSSNDLKTAAMLFFLLAAALVIPVHESGESSEEAVERLPGVTESLMEEHEEAAKQASCFTLLLGIGALAGLVASRKLAESPGGWRAWVPRALFVLAVVDAAALARTGSLGGEIRHTEIRTDASGSAPHEYKD
jgi:hypothetical protein